MMLLLWLSTCGKSGSVGVSYNVNRGVGVDANDACCPLYMCFIVLILGSERLTRAVRLSNEINLEETRIITLPFNANGSAPTRDGSVSQLEFVERELVERHFTASTYHFCGPSSAVELLATGGSNCSLESCDADTLQQREGRTVGIEIGICKNVIRALMHSIEMPFGMQ